MMLSRLARHSPLAPKSLLPPEQLPSRRRAWPATCNSPRPSWTHGANGFPCRGTRPAIALPNRLERDGRWLMLLNHGLYRRRDVGEAQFSHEERRDSLVVGRAKNRWVRAPSNSDISRQSQCGKSLSVRLLEMKHPDFSQIESLSC